MNPTRRGAAPATGVEILRALRESIAARARRAAESRRRIVGVTRTTYVLRLSPAETVLHLHYVLVQTDAFGCCYYDASTDEPGIDEHVIGRDAFDVSEAVTPIGVAALDAIYGAFVVPASRKYILTGTNIEKAEKRATIVVREVRSLLKRRRLKDPGKPRVLNVGIVGSILGQLADCGDIELRGSDFYRGVAGTRVHGAEVVFGSETPKLVGWADVAVVTGMTLANDTLAGILAAARESGTGLIIFAQTGAHFAEAYLKLGVDVVVSEPFPFYLVNGGPSTVGVYRKGG